LVKETSRLLIALDQTISLAYRSRFVASAKDADIDQKKCGSTKQSDISGTYRRVLENVRFGSSVSFRDVRSTSALAPIADLRADIDLGSEGPQAAEPPH
jgi:hypothetical protein